MHRKATADTVFLSTLKGGSTRRVCPSSFLPQPFSKSFTSFFVGSRIPSHVAVVACGTHTHTPFRCDAAAPPSPSSTTAVPLAQRLQQLKTECGNVYDTYAAVAPSSSAPSTSASAAPKMLDHRERSRLEHLVTEQVTALYKDGFSSTVNRVQVSSAEWEQLLRLLPSLAALSPPPMPRAPLHMLLLQILHPQKNDNPTPSVPDAALAATLLSLARLLHQPNAWAADQWQNVIAIRASAASLLAPLLRYFVAYASEAAVEAQWRQWQELANNALLSSMCMWVEEVDAQRTQGDNAAPRKRSSPTKSSRDVTASFECVLCQLVDLVDALAEHPCARSLPSDAWPSVLFSVVHLTGSPQQARQHLELAYAVLQVLMHVREKSVVSAGVWRQLMLEVVAKSIPHGLADAPNPIPVSLLSTSGVSYATLFLKYVHVTKTLVLFAVESSTDSTARDTASHLHAVLAGLVELSACVFIEKRSTGDGAAATTSTAGGRVSLLAAVVKELLTVRAESVNAPRQYARYVAGMLAGSAPMVPYMIKAMVTDCCSQVSLLAAPDVTSVLATNVEILQGVFLWSIHTIIDEGLLVATALPWALYDVTAAALGQLSERFSLVLLSNPTMSVKNDTPLLAVRLIACEGLVLLLHFLLFVVALYGITDEVSWNVRFRDQLYAAETRVMRIVAAFDCGVPHVLREFTDALEQISSLLGPTAAQVSALLLNSTRPSLGFAGCHGALDKLLEVLPVF
jgi:hypothetical protein